MSDLSAQLRDEDGNPPHDFHVKCREELDRKQATIDRLTEALREVWPATSTRNLDAFLASVDHPEGENDVLSTD